MKVIEAKIVVLGSQGVGKTSLVVRYIGKMFSKHISPTIGASFFTCNINLEDSRVKLQVWDTAGQERFRSMAPMYYRNANAALLVFDITSVSSFQAIKSWIKELKSNVPEEMILSVVGNKSDLESMRAVPYSEAAEYASSIGAAYCETSALHDQGIDQVFLNTASELLKLSNSNLVSSLRSYDSCEDGERLPTGTPTEEAATHTGKVELPTWSIDSIAHGETQKNINVPEEMILSVVGNKSDLESMRAVPYSEAAEYASSIGAAYCETSALHDQGIDQVFLNTASELLKLSNSNLVSSLRSYDSCEDGERLPTGTPTEEAATHTGKVELPTWSIDSIAHGETQKNMCC